MSKSYCLEGNISEIYFKMKVVLQPQTRNTNIGIIKSIITNVKNPLTPGFDEGTLLFEGWTCQKSETITWDTEYTPLNELKVQVKKNGDFIQFVDKDDNPLPCAPNFIMLGPPKWNFICNPFVLGFDRPGEYLNLAPNNFVMKCHFHTCAQYQDRKFVSPAPTGTIIFKQIPLGDCEEKIKLSLH